MTVKRFEVYDDGFSKHIEDSYYTKDKHEHNLYDIWEMCHKLNELHEKNEQLKKLCSILKEKIQFYEDQVVNPECPICHTILREISIDSKKDRYYRKCPKCGYKREESLI